MTFNVKTTLTPILVTFVLPACELCPSPAYDPTLDTETLTTRATEAQVYDIIRISPETWASMTAEEREAVLDHNCVYALRNPDAAPEGFDAGDCQ